ncbi:DnaJ domain-containing protein [Nanoarchaeota archaeon]
MEIPSNWIYSMSEKRELKDFYSILSIPFDATECQIKKAYRRCIKIVHPDANNHKLGYPELARTYNMIKTILLDSQERATYDLVRSFKGLEEVTDESIKYHVEMLVADSIRQSDEFKAIDQIIENF